MAESRNVASTQTSNLKRYKATATVSWEFEIADSRDAMTAAQKRLKELISCDECKTSFKINHIKQKKGGREVVGVFDPEDVLPFVTNGDDRREYVVDDQVHCVRMNSHRYFIFKASQKCASCGIVGSKMLLEKSSSETNPHFNLYAEEDGELVLLTKDHIRARSYGGEDRHSNYQTMCIICNNLKGSDNLKLDSLCKLRTIYNENKKLLPRKKLNALVLEEKKKLMVPNNWSRTSRKDRGHVQSKSKARESHVVTKCDLLILQNEDGDLRALSVYETPDKGKNEPILACLKKGTILEPVGSDQSMLSVAFNKTSFVVYQGYVEYVGVN